MLETKVVNFKTNKATKAQLQLKDYCTVELPAGGRLTGTMTPRDLLINTTRKVPLGWFGLLRSPYKYRLTEVNVETP